MCGVPGADIGSFTSDPSQHYPRDQLFDSMGAIVLSQLELGVSGQHNTTRLSWNVVSSMGGAKLLLVVLVWTGYFQALGI